MLFQFSAHALIGGVEVSPEEMVAQSTVAIIRESNNLKEIVCSGTVLGAKLIVTAAHCLDEELSDRWYIGHGINPLENKLYPVAQFKYVQSVYSPVKSPIYEIAILITRESLAGLTAARIGKPSSLSESSKLIQVGYGYNLDEKTSDFPFYGVLKKLTDRSFYSMEGKQALISESQEIRISNGDSGGPVFLLDESGLVLHGVVNKTKVKNEKYFAVYTHPYYFQNWIDCSLSNEMKIPVAENRTEQYGCGEEPLLDIEELPAYNQMICQKHNPGWILTEDDGCWMK